MIHFLDLLPIIERRIPDTSRVLPDPACPDTLSPDTAYAIASSDVPANFQQLADVSPIPSGLFGLLESNLLLTAIVVFLALSVCFFFVKKYRGQQKG